MHEQKQASGVSGHQLKALILTPTRELATPDSRIHRNLWQISELKSVVIFGCVSQSRQVSDLRRGCDFYRSNTRQTHGLMNQNYIVLNGIEYFVLDEADRYARHGICSRSKKNHNTSSQEKTDIIFLGYHATRHSDHS